MSNRSRKISLQLATCLLLLLSGTALFAQPLRKWVQAADASFEDKDYYSALKYYEIALRYDSSNTYFWYRMGRAAKEINAFSLAAQGFQKIIEKKAADKYPLTYYYLGDVQQHLGRFYDAADSYETFLESHPQAEEEYRYRAQKGIEDCIWAVNEIANNEMGIRLQHIEGRINTGFSEFGASIRSDTIFYTSYRFEHEEDDHWPKRKYFKIMSLPLGDTVSTLYEPWNIEGRHTAHVTFNRAQNTMYYSICDYADTSSAIECELYRRRMIDGRWSEPERLSINKEGYSSAQPDVGRLVGKEKKLLFFASNRPGGKGLNDIWYSEIQSDGELGEPVNLEQINTPVDEISPFFHEPSQRLYFSSDGQRTLGGLDIFRTESRQGEWTPPEHMGYPLNSSFDDAYFALNDSGSVALFATNRIGSIFLEPESESCCFDIWRVDYDVKGTLDVFTFHKRTKAELNGVRVELVEIDQFTGAETVLADLTNDTGNDFHFPIQIHKKYLIRGTRNGFSSALDSLDLTGMEYGTKLEFRKDLYLAPRKVDLEVLTFDEVTLDPVAGCTVELRPLVADSIMAAMTKTNEYGNDFLFPLEVDMPYLLTTTHPEYETKVDTLQFTFADLETYGDRVTVEVYLRKLFSCLPLVLYYDNDVPGPKGYDPETPISYADTYLGYYERKDQYFKTLTEGLPQEEADNQRAIMELFFERDVKGGYENLLFCTERLLTYLQNGNTATIRVVGSASPRGPSAYNQVLSQRRINSVINFFSTYEDGAIQPYLEDGSLQVIEEAVGERSGNPEVLDDLEDFNNVRSSIYSLPACILRSVEISEIKIEGQSPENHEPSRDK